MAEKNCNCNCHGIILHSPKCNKNKQKIRRLALKTLCSCIPHKQKDNIPCSYCYNNHKDSEHYESLKYISKIF